MQIYCRHSPLWIQEVVVECYVPHLALLYLTIVWTGCSSIRSDQYIIPYQARMIIIIPCGMAAPFTPCSTSSLAWPMWMSWMEQRFVSRASIKILRLSNSKRQWDLSKEIYFEKTSSHFTLDKIRRIYTGQNTFPILLLNVRRTYLTQYAEAGCYYKKKMPN